MENSGSANIRRVRYVRGAMAVVAFVLASSLAGSDAVRQPLAIVPGEGGSLFGRPDVDALLARPYAPHVPMACVGECLWAAHPDGWAFGNGINYYLLGAEGLGFDLEIGHEGEILTPGE
ncbi:MAG: hypothetical protein KJ052_05900, partial [Candidatus Hydrogenedentes bacterium]|nr:hypothetical protein [Candidatus Hydrogenedentota bacterium]